MAPSTYLYWNDISEILLTWVKNSSKVKKGGYYKIKNTYVYSFKKKDE